MLNPMVYIELSVNNRLYTYIKEKEKEKDEPPSPAKKGKVLLKRKGHFLQTL